MAESGTRVLVVDDETRLRESLARLLGHHGLDVVTAEGGRAALAVLERRRVDLVLLDLMMPDMSGLELLGALRRDHPELPAIVVSAARSIDAAIGTLREGGYDFIRKPYRTEDVLKSVDNALERERLARENRRMDERLQESERVHRYLVDCSPDIICVLDRGGRVVFANARLNARLGYAPDEIRGRHFAELIAIEDRERAEVAFRRRLRNEQAGDGIELRLLARQSGQEPQHFEINAFALDRPLFEADGGDPGSHHIYVIARDISERKRAEAVIDFQAYHDLLTHLPNRNLLKDRLGQAIGRARRESLKLGVMFLDIDRFKVVNDTAGHLRGDRLLQAVGQRIGEELVDGETVARTGGDEFMVLLPQVATDAEMETRARRIAASVKQPFFVEDVEINITASVGLATFPRHGETIDSLIRATEIAAWCRKRDGNDGVRFYDDEMDTVFSRRQTLERDLRRALKQSRFLLHYQPQVDTQGRILGVEALLRWNHPERGLVSPGEFIPLAEETGLVLPLTRWVLATACGDMARWRRHGVAPARIAVNVSALQVEQRDFVPLVLETLAAHGLDGACLEVEITEHVLFRDLDRVIRHIARLRESGVRVAIDDFGTGYSSLSYLRKLPIDVIKIDRSFVAEIDDCAPDTSIVAGVVAMAHGLGLEVVAEGVETPAQVEYLRSLDCGLMQGYYFSPPLALHEMSGRLADTWWAAGPAPLPTMHAES